MKQLNGLRFKKQMRGIWLDINIELSMLKSKYFDHYFQFMLIFYILVRKVGDFGP